MVGPLAACATSRSFPGPGLEVVTAYEREIWEHNAQMEAEGAEVSPIYRGARFHSVENLSCGYEKDFSVSYCHYKVYYRNGGRLRSSCEGTIFSRSLETGEWESGIFMGLPIPKPGSGPACSSG
jgi:hypothetical protein